MQIRVMLFIPSARRRMQFTRGIITFHFKRGSIVPRNCDRDVCATAANAETEDGVDVRARKGHARRMEERRRN